MQLAILIVSSASLVCSAGCLCILLKGAQEAQTMKSEVNTFKAKTARNFERVKTILTEMEV